MRTARLQTLLDACESAISAASPSPAAASAAQRVFGRCRSHVGEPGQPQRQEFPVHVHFERAVGLAGQGSPVGIALKALEPNLGWQRRASAKPEDAPFYDGHANAIIFGPGGLEERDDVWIGATLMAPGITYVDHDHPPEEVYLALTPGKWWNAEMDWTDPGTGGLIYNPPGIRHAMRSGKTPFLALWFLPV